MTPEGLEKFDYNRIQFPFKQIIKPQLPVRLMKCNKNQVELFDKNFDSSSESYQEVNHDMKLSYMEWIEQEFGLDEDSLQCDEPIEIPEMVDHVESISSSSSSSLFEPETVKKSLPVVIETNTRQMRKR